MDSRKTEFGRASLQNTLETLQALIKFTLRLFFWLRTSKWTMASVLAWDPSPLQRHFLMTKKPKQNLYQNPWDAEWK